MSITTLCNRKALACLATFAFVLLALASAPAEAQLTDREWELGFAVGNANVDSSGEDFDLDVRTEIRAGYLFTDQFQLELQAIRASAILDAELTALMANGVFSFRPDKVVVPYVLVGAGYSNLDDINFLGTSPSVDEDAEAYQAAFGARFFVGDSDRMALRFELSSLWIETDLFEADRHTSLTAGLSWMLGQR